MMSPPEPNTAPGARSAFRRTLPSGRSIVLRRPRDFHSAFWEMAGSGGVFQVRRPRRGNSSEHEYAKNASSQPLELTEEDAFALVTMLNEMLSEASDGAAGRSLTRVRRSG